MFNFSPSWVFMSPPTNGYSVNLSRQTTSYTLNNSNNFNGNVANQAYGKVSSDRKTYYWYTGYTNSSGGPSM